MFPSQSTVWAELDMKSVWWREEGKARALVLALVAPSGLLTAHLSSARLGNIRRPDQFYDVFCKTE